MWVSGYKESWALKNWCFWTVVLRRLLRVHCTAGRSNQSILKISPGCSLEGLILKLKLQYFSHLMQSADSFEKTLRLGKIEGRRRRGWQRMRWFDGITDSVDMVWVNSGSWWWKGGLACWGSWGCKELDTTEWLNWTELYFTYPNVKLKENIFKLLCNAKFKNFEKLKYQKVNKSVIRHLLSAFLSLCHISILIFYFF